MAAVACDTEQVPCAGGMGRRGPQRRRAEDACPARAWCTTPCSCGLSSTLSVHIGAAVIMRVAAEGRYMLHVTRCMNRFEIPPPVMEPGVGQRKVGSL